MQLKFVVAGVPNSSLVILTHRLEPSDMPLNYLFVACVRKRAFLDGSGARMSSAAVASDAQARRARGGHILVVKCFEFACCLIQLYCITHAHRSAIDIDICFSFMVFLQRRMTAS